MDDLKNVKTEKLAHWEQTIARHRKSLDWVGAESDRLSPEAQMELARVRRGLRIDYEAVTAELGVRARMMPVPQGAEVSRVA